MEYLMDYDLTDFNIRKIPETKISRDMKKVNTAPVYEFLNDILKEEKYKTDFIGEYFTEGECEYFNVSTFKTKYQEFCNENELQHLNIPLKVYYALMNEIGISKMRVTYLGEQTWRLGINVKRTQNALQSLIVKD